MKKSSTRVLKTIPKFILLAGVSTLATAGGMIVSGMLAKTSTEAPDYLIVLGARVNGEDAGEALKSRIDAARNYLEAHPGTTAILSGARTRNATITEAECMRRALTAAGIFEERLILEERAKTTDENILFSLMMIPEDATVGILSNDFHLFRAQSFARKCGMKVSVHPVPCPKRILPLAFAREQLAVIVWAVTGKL